MIKFRKYFFNKATILLSLVVLTTACETTELDLLDSPNTLTPAQADVNLFLNAMQISFANFVENVTDESAEVTRIKHMFGPTYANAYGPTTFDATWRVYSGFLADARGMVPLAEAQELYIHSGIAKVLEAYIMVTLVDMFGDVPYSQALDPNILNPDVDSGADIYAAMYDLIDDAINDFNTPALAAPSNDFYYDGDATKWRKFARSLQLKMALTTGLVDGSAASRINTLIATNDLIDEASEDMAFPWGTNILSPDSRHPLYGPNYDNATSSAHYMSTGFMYSIVLEKGIEDPRRRYYFYRQVDANTTDVNEQSCIVKPKPGHYSAEDRFCNINHPGNSNGYWGRDHGNADGIPPDDFLKTTYGVYPVGGQYDADQAAPVEQSLGGAGAGITPVLLSSYVHFMRAAAALELGTNDNARTQLEAGIRASMDKVTNFLPGVDRGGMDADDTTNINNYVNFVLAEYDAASVANKLEIVIKEYYLALFGNGIESYNNYRRTGYPNGLQPTILAQPGPFMRSMLYPSVFVNLNSVVSQKPDLTQRVFWDTNSDPLN